MNDALGVDGYGDVVERDPEQVMCLDHLQPLVHEGGRVDGDLGAHRPARVVERLVHGDLVEVEIGVGPERAARRGDDQTPDVLGALAPKALPDGAVLRVDGAQAAFTGCLHHQRTGHDQHLFGRQRDLLAGLEGQEGRRQRSRAGDGDQHQVAARIGDHGLDPGVEIAVAGLALDHVVGGAPGRAAALGEAEQSQPGGIAVDDVERLLSDRAGGAEDGHVDGARHRASKPNMLT